MMSNEVKRKEAFQKAEGIPTSTRIHAVLLIVGFVAGIRAYMVLVPGYLIQPVSPNLIAFAIFFGVLAALAIVYRWATRLLTSGTAPRCGQILTIVAAVWLVGYRAPVMAAAASVQIASFAGMSPASNMTQLTVTGTHYDWWAKRGGYHVDARLSDTGYAVSLPASKGAYDAARAGEQIVLPVETGRYGIRRIVMSHQLRL